VESFEDVSSDPEFQNRLAEVYDDVDEIDLWVGGLSEDPMPGSHVGELFHTLIIGQFEALRDGDRFWYELTLSQIEKEEIENTRLSDIVRRNTNIGNEIQDDVFHIGSRTDGTGVSSGCSLSYSGTKESLTQYLLISLAIFFMIAYRRHRNKKS